MFCTNCGKQIPDGTNYCPNCGARIDISLNAKAGDTHNVISETNQPESEPVIKKNKSLKFFIPLIAIICIIGIAALFLGRQENNSNTSHIAGLSGEYYLIGNGLPEVIMNFDSQKVTISVDGDVQECRYKQSFDSGNLDISIYQTEKSGGIFSSQTSETTRTYFDATMLANEDGSFTAVENKGLLVTYGNNCLCTLIPESVYTLNTSISSNEDEFTNTPSGSSFDDEQAYLCSLLDQVSESMDTQWYNNEMTGAFIDESGEIYIETIAFVDDNGTVTYYLWYSCADGTEFQAIPSTWDEMGAQSHSVFFDLDPYFSDYPGYVELFYDGQYSLCAEIDNSPDTGGYYSMLTDLNA